MPLTLDWKEWRARSLAKSKSNSKQSQDDKENVAPLPLFSPPLPISPEPECPKKSYKWAPNESERQAMKEVYESQMANYIKKKREQAILKELKEHCEQQHIEWRQRQIVYMKRHPQTSIDLDCPWDENAIA